MCLRSACAILSQLYVRDLLTQLSLSTPYMRRHHFIRFCCRSPNHSLLTGMPYRRTVIKNVLSGGRGIRTPVVLTPLAYETSEMTELLDPATQNTFIYTLCSGDRNRTCDLQIMRLMSYHCSTPQHKIQTCFMYLYINKKIPEPWSELGVCNIERMCSSQPHHKTLSRPYVYTCQHPFY